VDQAFLFQGGDSISLVSTEMVPTSTGRPARAFLDFLDDGVDFRGAFMTESCPSLRMFGLLVGIVITPSL